MNAQCFLVIILIGQRIGEVINTPEDPEKKISYVLDITKQYNNMLTESKGERKANYYYDNGTIALDIDDITSYYMQDDLGSILGLTDNECNIIESYDYDEFGNELEPVSNPIQSLTYTGYRKELATNSLYAQARQYNPRVGRFTSEDIIKGDRLMPISLNSYVYCCNMSNNMIDVDGRKHVDAVIAMSPNKGEYAKYGIERNTGDSIFADDYDGVYSSLIEGSKNALTDTDNIKRAYQIKMEYDNTPEFKIVEKSGKQYAYVYDSAYYSGGRGGARRISVSTLESGNHSLSKSFDTARVAKYGGKALKVVGALAVVYDAGTSFYEEYHMYDNTDVSGDVRFVNSTVEAGTSVLGGIIAGAVAGAIAGSVVPGFGTVAGFVVGLAVSAVVYFIWDLALNIRIGDYSIKEWIKIGANKMWNTFCDKSEKTNECFGT